MTTPDYPSILSRRYLSRAFTMRDTQDPSTIIAGDGGPVPTKADLDALWPSVEVDIAVEQAALQQQNKFAAASPDALLKTLEVLIDAAIDTRAALNATSQAKLSTTVTDRLATTKGSLVQARQ